MQVAIRIDAGDLVLAVDEVRRSGAANGQITQLAAVLGGEVDELDVVLVGHRVGLGTNRDAVMAFT